jgi:cation diffusion facilitator family transporter
MKRANLTRYAWLSVGTAILTISLKLGAYLLTDSVGLLSDALESLINLAAAIIALIMLKIAAAPPDEDHAFGHDKAEYFASGIEGTMIFVAAVSIAYTAITRIYAPQPIEQVGWGLLISTVATVINLIVGRILIAAGRNNHSITLEADGEHLMTDVWTSAGVFVGIIVVYFTGWFVLDPVIALIVAVNITWTGYKLIKRSALGLMDTVVSDEDLEKITTILDGYAEKDGVDYHALRTRQAGSRKFISFHVLVPDDWTVQKGHDLCESIEVDICKAVEYSVIFTHLEPIEDPLSWQDIELMRRVRK